MNKLLGYMELQLEGEVIPIKIGCWTLEKFCESFEIGLDQIGSIFVMKEKINEKGEKEMFESVKDPIKFLSTVLLHGANYAALVSGKPSYALITAYNWVDEIGLTTPQAMEVMRLFFSAILNGGTPAKEAPASIARKTSKKKALNVG